MGNRLCQAEMLYAMTSGRKCTRDKCENVWTVESIADGTCGLTGSVGSGFDMFYTV